MTKKTFKKIFAYSFLLLFMALNFPGCDKKEKIIDIETPRGKVEVERNKDTGDVEVEVERKKKEKK